MNALIYFLACFGLSWIIVESALTYGIRLYLQQKSEQSKLASFLSELTSCMVCTSWWVALFTLLTPFPYNTFEYEHFIMYFYLPFAVSALMVFWLEATGEFDDA